MSLELRKLNPSNIWEACRLSVTIEQKDFVAPNNLSIIEAFATREVGGIALPYAIYNKEEMIGFVMLGYGRVDDDDPQVAEGNYCLWRFMIDAKYQGQGLGRAAMHVILEEIRSFPVGKAELCWLSYEPENSAAKKLYASFGFVETGEICSDEIVAVLSLS